ncbi:MAG: OB-fold domain-containing protein [bacterium]
MISFISGKIKAVSNRFAIIETGGLGYQVYISPIVLSKFKPGEAVELFTHLQVRDYAMEL